MNRNIITITIIIMMMKILVMTIKKGFLTIIVLMIKSYD